MASRSRRIVKRLFRWSCRLLVLLVLALLVIAVYLEKAGLPEFLKKRLVQQVQARGWELDFSAMRFHWYRGIVAENVVLRRADNTPGPIIFVDEAACQLRRENFRRFKFEPQSVNLRGGRIVWQLVETNQPTATIRLDHVGGELLLKPNDLWELRSLNAEVLGTSIQIAGTLTNASLVRDWKFPKSSKSAEATQALWRKIAANAERVRFAGQPQLFTRFDADAGELDTLHADFKFLAEGVETPWGGATNAVLYVRVSPAQRNEPLQADLEFTAEHPETEWCRARKIRMNWQVEAPFVSLFPSGADIAVDLLAPETPWARARRAVSTVHVSSRGTNAAERLSRVHATLDQLQSEWGRADYSQLSLTLQSSGTNMTPALAIGELRSSKAQTRWGDASTASIEFKANVPETGTAALLNTNNAWPERLEGIFLETTVRASNVLSGTVEIDNADLKASWRSPRLVVQTELALGGGRATATAQVHSVTREVVFAGNTSFDPQSLYPLFSPKTQAWFSNYTWRAAPEVKASGRVILPAWTNQHPDWLGEVRPTVSLAGDFRVGEGAFRDVPFQSASSSFFLTNLFWHLPDLRVQRPEGSVFGEYSSDLGTRDFFWNVHCRINPKAIRPLLEEEQQQQALDYFQFSQPPEIEAKVWSRWGEMERLGIEARVRGTNCSYRGESVTAFDAGVSYTNKLLVFTQPHVWQGEREAQAPRIFVDLATQRIFFTNAFGNLDPMSVARAIGPKSAEAIEPYRYDLPPFTRVNGSVDLKKGRHEDDLHFQINGGPFRWRQFRLQRLGGNIDWVGDKVSLNNMRGAFRNGNIGGAAAFDFTRGQGANFSFNLGLSDADLRTFMPDIGYPTNHLEGLLNGELVIRSAKTADQKSWQGEGKLELRDGLIWEIPMFGAFSPVLNSLAPGLGNSRAKQATSTFIITNSLVVSRDMEIRATAMRMNFDGAVDFDGRVDARVEAELLRDIPAIGWLFSKLLWPVSKLFEYHVTGTLSQPKLQPYYIATKIILMPFHPFKTLRDLAPPDEQKPPPKQ
jgi:hypothetical protein